MDTYLILTPEQAEALKRLVKDEISYCGAEEDDRPILVSILEQFKKGE